MGLKANVQHFPEAVQRAIVDLCGTRHDDHACYEEEAVCPMFDSLMDAIDRYASDRYLDGYGEGQESGVD